MTGAGVAVADGDFEAVYVTGDGAECRVDLADLGGLRLEDGRPVRSFPSYRGQRNYPGWYTAAQERYHPQADRRPAAAGRRAAK